MVSEIAFVIALKAACSALPHEKLTPFFVRFLKGPEMVAKLSINWELNPTMPRKDRTSSFDLGASAAQSAATLSGSGKIPLSEKMYPKNYVFVALKTHFLRFKVSPVRRNI